MTYFIIIIALLVIIPYLIEVSMSLIDVSIGLTGISIGLIGISIGLIGISIPIITNYQRLNNEMKTLQRNYNLDDADLMMFALNMKSSIERDKVYFADRGVSDADILAFKNLSDSFKSFPLDVGYIGMIMIETDAKWAARHAAIEMIQKVSGYFDQRYGIGSAEYDRLQIGNLFNLTDKDFLFAGRNVVSVATNYFSELSAIGLEQSELNSLAAEMNLFESKLYSVAEKVKLRRKKRLERIALGNELYIFVAQYCRIGKLIWANTNPVYYNNYVVYHGRKKKAKTEAPKA